ncbi:hypothetical protein [Actinomadura geliboluensis]|uniref:hypothetical protein n=1 Tax=Actinomadura geliboluensis TaxID=882440 RepID=UPI0037219ABA
MHTATGHPRPQPTPVRLARLVSPAFVSAAVPVVGWVCGTCGGGGVASDGSTCADCHGHGHTI